MIKPDGKRIEFEVDEHDVPYLLEHIATAVPAQMPENKENVQPTTAQIAETKAQSDEIKVNSKRHRAGACPTRPYRQPV